MTDFKNPDTCLMRDSAESVLPQKQDVPYVKRGFDLLIGFVALICSLPLLLAVMVYIKIVSPGPVFYVQSRLGYGGRYFKIYKFRTLRHRAQPRDSKHQQYVSDVAKNDGLVKKPELAGELIFGGAVLRALSIDELPQLLNVLKGEMSLVGPRPDLLNLEDYAQEQLRRFEVLPGLTGLWQISSDKDEMPFSQMMKLDMEYVDRQSILLDLRIIFKTVFKILSPSNF